MNAQDLEYLGARISELTGGASLGAVGQAHRSTGSDKSVESSIQRRPTSLACAKAAQPPECWAGRSCQLYEGGAWAAERDQAPLLLRALDALGTTRHVVLAVAVVSVAATPLGLAGALGELRLDVRHVAHGALLGAVDVHGLCVAGPGAGGVTRGRSEARGGGQIE